MAEKETEVAALELKTDEQLKAMSTEELIQLNQVLMAEKDAITEYQLRVKAAINSHAALERYKAMPEAEKAAIAQHIQAGGIASRTAAS